MKTKVSELTEKKLAEWTAKARGWIKAYPLMEDGFPSWIQGWFSGDKEVISVGKYRPDINGAQAMELVKHFNIAVVPPELSGLEKWAAGTVSHYSLHSGQSGAHEIGETPEIAICRAVVASVYGEYVEEDE